MHNDISDNGEGRKRLSTLVALVTELTYLPGETGELSHNYWGLVINASKTKHMKGRGSREDSANLPPRVQVGGDEIKVVVDEFVYLGSLLTADNDTSREIQRRIMAGYRAYLGLRRTLRSSSICRRTKLTIYKTLIRPVVLYGHETWTMLVEDQRALACFLAEGIAYHLRWTAEGERSAEKANEPRTNTVGAAWGAIHLSSTPLRLAGCGGLGSGTRRRGAQLAR
ncbi:uncharacterized protein LOC129733796 [Wyeomyia smithii]|uniref:uncharacterized protein LOC129733796 n=1 Tax=Wyeomyia smithii TaxID=174621 RepID=UPI002467E944|nr:uncharacterized protein LOC129733796 [Wyeomyia smithii]